MFTCLDITFHHCLGPKKIENILKDINFVIIVNLRFGGPSVKVDNFRFHGSQVHQLTIYNNIMNGCAVGFKPALWGSPTLWGPLTRKFKL